MFSGGDNFISGLYSKCGVVKEARYQDKSYDTKFEFPPMSNATFRAVRDVWGRDVCKDIPACNKNMDDFVSDWVVTMPPVGPMSQDNICQLDGAWTADDGKFKTPEGEVVEVNIESRLAPRQAAYLISLQLAGRAVSDSGVAGYFAEFGRLAAARWNLSGDKGVAEKFFQSVKFTFGLEPPCEENKSDVEIFLAGVSGTISKEGALSDTDFNASVTQLSSVDDKEMAHIIMSARKVLMARQMLKEAQDPVLQADIANGKREEAKKLLQGAKEILAKNLNIKCEVAQQKGIADRIIDAAAQMGFVEVAKEARDALRKIWPIFEPAVRIHTASELDKLSSDKRRDMVRWIIDKSEELMKLAQPQQVTAADCLEKEPKGTFVLNKAGTDCEPCPPNQKTETGEPDSCKEEKKTAADCLNKDPKGTHILKDDECVPCATLNPKKPKTRDGLKCVGRGGGGGGESCRSPTPNEIADGATGLICTKKGK